ncbi:hypothetical protein INT45_011780 [Circinella minor]|uniref:RRM domain-containing protein n=1 Tax=Circinella minor TaxID=1195481 RepID=A0A8H7VQJ5_9FUNG|nr:hypothetical protein INT45_011780 [Circinella minor]
MARFFNEDHEKVFVLAPQIDDDEENFLVRYNSELIEIFSGYNNKQQEQSIDQSAGLNEYYYKGVRRIIAGHIQFHNEAQAERAYALFNDTSIIITKNPTAPNIRRVRIRLELLYYDQTPVDDSNINNNNNGNNKLLPALLHIRGIPPTIHNWFQETYDTFRKQGRLLKCQRRHRCAIHQSNMQKSSEYCSDKHDPTIIVQYMSKEESDKAMIQLNGSVLFDSCIMSIIVKTTPPAYPPEKSSDNSKRPMSYTKIKTRGHGRLSQDSLASPSSSSSSSSTVFQQRSSQQRYHHHQRQQQQPTIIDEKPPTTPTTISSTTASASPTKPTSNNNRLQRLELKPAMDLCNIYIKHIDPSIKSTELFNLFKPFGRIISARVMEDPSTGSSRGFGFVSYSHPTEAAEALIEMDGYTGPDSNKVENPISSSTSGNNDGNEQKSTEAINEWIGEPMSVRFHEPRVPRPERDYQQQVLKLFQSHLSPHFSFDCVLPAVSSDTITSGNADINSTEDVTGGLAHHGNTVGTSVNYSHHHHPPPPLMMPPPAGPHHQQHSPTAYYSPYSPSPTQSTQPVSPFTLQHHHPYIFSPTHSSYVIPHSPRATGTNSTYYYYYPQQTHIIPEYFTSPLPTAQQQQQMIHHQQSQQSSQSQRQYTPVKYQQQSSSPSSLQKPKKATGDEQKLQQTKMTNKDEKHNNELVTSNNTDVTSSDSSVNTPTNNKEKMIENDEGRQRLFEAVRQNLPQNESDFKINNVVDKLMERLDRKERSICLFNEDYLEHRIKQVFES